MKKKVKSIYKFVVDIDKILITVIVRNIGKYNISLPYKRISEDNMDNNYVKNKVESPSMLIKFEEGFEIQGISNVIENNESSFVASVGGNILTVSGSKFNLDSLDIAGKTAKVSGRVTALKLAKTRQKVSPLKRIFK